MRKITYVFALLFISCLVISCNKSNPAAKIDQEKLETAKTRDVAIKKGAASIAFNKKEHDFGTITEGDVVETTFKVTNSGKTDLVISDAKVTCGCTVPVWPKEAIKPGEEKDIKVRFNSNGKKGKQQKNITLITNTEAGREILTLKGMVTPKDK